MPRSKSSRPENSFSSAPSNDFTNYMIPDLNELANVQDDSTSNNSNFLNPQVPSHYTMVEVGHQKGVKNEPSKRKRTDRSHRKKSFVEHDDALVIKEVDEEPNSKVRASAKQAYSPTKDPQGFERYLYDEYEENDKPNYIIELNEPSPSTAEKSGKLSNNQRYDSKPKQNQTKNSRNSRSSKVHPSSIVILPFSDSVEERKMEAYKKQLKLDDSANIIVSQNAFSNVKKRLDYANKIIPRGQSAEFNFQREQVCCHNFSKPQFTLTQKNGGFVLSAKKQMGYLNSCYFLSVDQDNFDNKDECYSGYLQGNFTGSEFNLFTHRKTTDQHEIIATIVYEGGLKCVEACRKMSVFVKNPQNNDKLGEGKTSLKNLYDSTANNSNRSIMKFVTKQPKYNKKHDCYSINFKGKSKLASIKNMALIDEDYPSPSDYILMFCKTQDHEFHLQAASPLTPLMSLAIVLSGFDFKLCCQ